jgi:hypothetical protein
LMKLVLLGKRVSLLEERVSSLENRVTLVMSIKVFEPLAMINSIFITPSPKGVGVMGWRPSPGLNPLETRECSPKPLRTRGNSCHSWRGGGR